MAFATVFRHISKSQNFNSVFLFEKIRSFSTLAPSCSKPFINPFQVRLISTPAETLGGIGEMVSGAKQNYYMLSKNGGIGETSSVASLAVKFETHSYSPIVVSTYPVYSLSNSFDQCLRGAALVPVEGVQSSLFPLEINSEKMEENFQSAIQRNCGSDVKDFMDSMHLGLLSQQLEELELGELLVSPPPGLDKATLISKACYTTPRLSIDAVYQPTRIQRSSSTIIQCGPKKIKFAKQRKGSMKGIAHRGNHISFGAYALQALEPGWITSKQLESGRRALARNLGRGVKIWVRVFPDKPVSAKPAETRMGRGKGNVQFWVAVVQPGRILYEMGGTSESIARKAISVASSKLPIRTRFIALEEGIKC